MGVAFVVVVLVLVRWVEMAVHDELSRHSGLR